MNVIEEDPVRLVVEKKFVRRGQRRVVNIVRDGNARIIIKAIAGKRPRVGYTGGDGGRE